MINFFLLTRWLHTLSFAVWFGGLVFLSFVLYGSLQKFPLGSNHSRLFLGRVTHRFAWLGLVALTVGALSGLMMGAEALNTVALDLARFKYGLVSILFILAAWLVLTARQVCHFAYHDTDHGDEINRLYKRLRWLIRFAILFSLPLPYLILI